MFSVADDGYLPLMSLWFAKRRNFKNWCFFFTFCIFLSFLSYDGISSSVLPGRCSFTDGLAAPSRVSLHSHPLGPLPPLDSGHGPGPGSSSSLLIVLVRQTLATRTVNYLGCMICRGGRHLGLNSLYTSVLKYFLNLPVPSGAFNVFPILSVKYIYVLSLKYIISPEPSMHFLSWALNKFSILQCFYYPDPWMRYMIIMKSGIIK